MKRMKILSSKSLKLAFLAATAGAIVASAGAATAQAEVAPTYVATAVTPAARDQDDAQGKMPAAKIAGLAAFFAGALALGMRLIGTKRLDAAVAALRPHAARAAKAAGAAVRAAKRLVFAPARAALLALGLAVLALTGIDLFNLEWTIGLGLGAAAIIAALAPLNWSRRARMRQGK